MDRALADDLQLTLAERATARVLEHEGLLKSVLDIGRAIEPKPGGRLVWRILSPEQRQALGNDFLAAYHLHGSIGMWMRSTNQGNRFKAIVCLAEELGSVPPSEHRRMKLAVGDEKATPAARERPSWDRCTGVLRFRGQEIRRVRYVGTARNVVTVLDAFEEEGWPDRIDDPLPRGALHSTLASLRKGLRSIRFSADGSGKGIRWQPSRSMSTRRLLQ